MGGAFSSSSSSNNGNNKKAATIITDVDRAILDLKNARDRLTKYNIELETSIQKLVARARAAKEAGRTPTALGLLRLKKYKQTQVENVQNQLLNVHQLVETIDSQRRNAQIVQSLKAGKEALAKLHQETTVEDVLTLMDEIAEQNQVEQEITQVINGAVPMLSADDEAAVEAELEAMQSQMQVEGGVQPEEMPNMPVEPHTKLPEVKATTTTGPTKEKETEKNKQTPERLPIAG